MVAVKLVNKRLRGMMKVKLSFITKFACSALYIYPRATGEFSSRG